MLRQNWRYLSVVLVLVVLAFFADANTTRNCSEGALPAAEPGAVLKWRPSDGLFQPGQVAVFVCTDNYRQIGWLPRFTCEADGKWSNSTIEGYCQLSTCNMTTINNTRRFFQCADEKKTIDLCHKCNCVLDCADGSDETACGAILRNVTGMHQGFINNRNEDPQNTHLALNCSQTFWTEDPGRSILLNFDEFDGLLPDCEEYVYLNNAVFVDPVRDPECSKSVSGVRCAFCGRESPPLARARGNWLTVTWHISNTSEQRSNISATWYNVISSFPSGLLPAEEETFPPFLVLANESKPVNQIDADDSAVTAASVLFGCFLTVSLLILLFYVVKKVILPRNPSLAAWFTRRATACRTPGACRERAPSCGSNESAEERTPLRRSLPSTDRPARSPVVDV